MEIKISIAGDANPIKIFNDLEIALKSHVYKLELKTETKTITSEHI